jgi:hypothetical protein
VAEVREKQAISRQATVGFYWWARAKDLVDACCILIAQNHRTKGEFYLAPTYNELIERYQAKIKAVEIVDFHGLGTPEDVQAFPGGPAPSALTETFREQGEIRAPWALP